MPPPHLGKTLSHLRPCGDGAAATPAAQGLGLRLFVFSLLLRSRHLGSLCSACNTSRSHVTCHQPRPVHATARCALLAPSALQACSCRPAWPCPMACRRRNPRSCCAQPPAAWTQWHPLRSRCRSWRSAGQGKRPAPAPAPAATASPARMFRARMHAEAWLWLGKGQGGVGGRGGGAGVLHGSADVWVCKMILQPYGLASRSAGAGGPRVYAHGCSIVQCSSARSAACKLAVAKCGTWQVHGCWCMACGRPAPCQRAEGVHPCPTRVALLWPPWWQALAMREPPSWCG